VSVGRRSQCAAIARVRSLARADRPVEADDLSDRHVIDPPDLRDRPDRILATAQIALA
jgi:hypothetical protein